MITVGCFYITSDLDRAAVILHLHNTIIIIIITRDFLACTVHEVRVLFIASILFIVSWSALFVTGIYCLYGSVLCLPGCLWLIGSGITVHEIRHC